MAAGDKALSLMINITGNSSGAMSAIKMVSGSLSMLMSGNIVAGIVAAAVAVTAAIVGIGIVATKMAGDYQQGMNKVQALTGSSAQQMALYDAGLKQLAVTAGVAPTALTDGLYNVLSASYKGATALQVLSLATQDAKIGMTSATVTTDALTNILRSFGTKTQDITRVNGEMLETVTLGKSTFEQYASTIVKAASSAVQFHVSMETMNAAWSTMTSAGIRAKQASTDFQQSLQAMYGNIGTITNSLHKSGIAFNETAFNAMDYGHKVVYLNTALEEAHAKHVKVTGVTLQTAQAIQAISKHINDYNSNLAILSNKQAMAQKTQQAWAITQGGFNQTMDRLHATVDVVMISIGQKLLPVFTKIASNLLPVIQGFGDWITKSGILDQVASGLTKGIAFLVGTITNLISTGAQVVSFFQNNQLAMDGLKAVLAGVAAGVLAFVATTIPPLVVAFGAWAVAAGAAALATLVAAAPFIAIGLVVAAVVFGIILAVQHWGQIIAWLKGVWSAFSGWFMGALGAIGNFFHSIWTGIQTGLQAAWNFIVNIVKVGAHLLFLAIFGPFIAIGALFQWLYDHNTYFKDLIDKIVGFVKAGIAWLQNAWNTVVKWLVGLWGTILSDVKAGWQKISGVFSGIWSNYIAGPLGAFWNQIVKWVSDFMAMEIRGFQIIWEKVSGVFSTIWNNYIAKPLGSLWNSISKWFSDLAQGALNSGKNFIQMLVNGITSGAGAIWNAVSGIAGTIWKALGFHSPTEAGPGADADRWMPNLINMLVGGLNAGVPAMSRAALNVAAPLAQLSGGGSFALSGAHAGNAFALSGSAGNAFALGNGGQTIVVQVQPAKADITMDHRKVGEGVMKYAQRELHLQGTIHNR